MVDLETTRMAMYIAKIKENSNKYSYSEATTGFSIVSLVIVEMGFVITAQPEV